MADLRFEISAQDANAQAEIQKLDASLKSLKRTVAELNTYSFAPDVLTRESAKLNAEIAQTTAKINELKSQLGTLPASAQSVKTVAAGFNESSTAARLLNAEMNHLIPQFDSLMRGQRGQLVASFGAAFRQAGLGITALLPGIAAFAALMGGAAIIRGAERMGDMAQKLQAGAMAAGMSLQQFSSLTGALQLLGIKSDAADASLRIFARNLETAVSEPSSKAAAAFHALGIAQSELSGMNADTYAAFMRTVQAMSLFANDANKSAAATELLGRGFEHVVPLITGGTAQLERLQQVARDVGVVLSDQDAQALESTGQKIHELGVTIEGSAIRTFLAWNSTIARTVDLLNQIVGAAGSAASAIKTVLSNIPPVFPGGGIITALTQLGGSDQAPGGYVDVPQAPKPSAGRMGDAVPAMDRIREQIADARDKAASLGGTARGMREAETQAEIKTIQDALKTFDLSEKEKTQLRAEESRARVTLANQEASGAANAAKQAYMDFAATERLKIQEAKGDSGLIQSIYSEWENAAKTIYKQNASEFEKIEREKVAALQKAVQERIALEIQGANAQERAYNDIAKGFEAQMQTMVKQRKISPQQAFGFDIEEVSRIAGEQRKVWQDIMSNPQASAAQQGEAYWKLWGLGTETDTKILELQEKIAAAAKTASDKFAQPFVQAFDKLGSAFESAITGALTGEKNVGAKIAKSLVAGMTSVLSEGISKALASALGATGGEGFGKLLGGWVASGLGSILPGAGFLKGIIPGFQEGGITPGGLVMTHPGEMIVPSSPSTSAFRRAMGNTGFTANNSANLSYSPTVNMSGGSSGMGRSDMRRLLQDHGDELMSTARQMIRNGWNPSLSR